MAWLNLSGRPTITFLKEWRVKEPGHQPPAHSTSAPQPKSTELHLAPRPKHSPVVQLFSYFRDGFPGRPLTECDCAAIHHAALLLVKDSFFSFFLTVSHQLLAVALSLFSFCYLVRSRNLPGRTLLGSKKRDPLALASDRGSIIINLHHTKLFSPSPLSVNHRARWSPFLFPAITSSPRLARARLGRVLLSLSRGAPTSQRH
jgi:hypothetical protein